MVEATYFRKVRTALISRCAERDLSVGCSKFTATLRSRTMTIVLVCGCRAGMANMVRRARAAGIDVREITRKAADA